MTEKWKKQKQERAKTWYEIFAPSTAKEAIENATVYSEPLPHDNRKFGTRYYGKDKQAVEARAKSSIAAMDPYRSPHVSATFQSNNFWNVEVSWYSVE